MAHLLRCCLTLDHRKYFFVVDWVVELSCCEFARVETDQVELPIEYVNGNNVGVVMMTKCAKNES